MRPATGLFGESRTRRRGGGRLGGGGFSALEPLDQVGEQAPEEGITRIAADPANLATLIDQHEHRSEAFAANESEIGRDGMPDIETAQRHLLALAGLVIGRRDLTIELL